MPNDEPDHGANLLGKCAEILVTHYQEDVATWSILIEQLKITVLDKSQNRVGLTCPRCEHTMICVLSLGQ